MRLILATVAMLVATAGCDTYKDRFVTVADIADEAHVTIKLFGSYTPTSLVVFLDYPGPEQSKLLDGRCWTSDIVATMDGLPMEIETQGRSLNWADGTRGCWGGVYVVDPVEFPYQGGDVTEFRFYDDSGEIVVRTRAMFETPRLEVNGDFVRGEVAVVRVLPSTTVLGTQFYFNYNGPLGSRFDVSSGDPGLVVGYDSVEFMVPLEIEPPQTGLLTAETTDTGGAQWVEVTGCDGASTCRAYRAAEQVGLRSLPLMIDHGYGPPLEAVVNVVAAP